MQHNSIGFFNNLYTTFGVGKKTIQLLYLKAGVNKSTFPKQIKKLHQKKILKKLKNKKIGKKLKKKINDRIKFYIEIRSYKGIRHAQKYPIRGQRTHTNAKTKKKLSIYIL